MNDEPREQLPARTTPTWEMELLLSGATIFGLLQLPKLIDRGYYRIVNLASDDYARLLMPMWLYAKVAVVTLVLTFLAHLCLRGYWVALVGMNSVYPGGIRWDHMGLGRIARERYAAGGDPIPEAIERADNRATRVFGVGFSFAMIMLAPLLLVLLAILVSLVVGAITGARHPIEILFGLVVVLMLPWALTSLLDRRFAWLLDKAPALGRAVAASTNLYGRLGFGPRSNPVIALFASNAGRVRFAVTALAVILPVAMAIIMQSAFARGQTPLGFTMAVSGKQVFTADASPTAFYGDQRGEAWTLLPLPWIPTRVVEGPYLELFVPFIPRRHGAALDRACPRALGRGPNHGPRLQCLARITAIQLDGRPVAVPLLESTDPVTGQPGLVAMLPIAALPPGRHEVSLNEPPRTAYEGGTPRRYRIAFWK